MKIHKALFASVILLGWICPILISGPVPTGAGDRQRRKTALDRIVHVERDVHIKIPYFQHWCDRAEAKAIAEIHEIWGKIQAGAECENSSMPPQTFLRFLFALHHPNIEALQTMQIGAGALASQVLESWEGDLANREILRALFPPECPAEETIWPVFLKDPTTDALADTHIIGFRKSRWLRIGNACAPTDWRSVAKQMKKIHGGIPSFRTLSARELLAKVQSKQPVIVVDCRPAEEYCAGHVPRAVNVSMDSLSFGKETVLKKTIEDIQKDIGEKTVLALVDLESLEEYMPLSKLEELVRRLPEDRNREVIFYCRRPECTRSPMAIRWALALGYRNVRRFEGGWKEWSEKKYPLER